MNLIKLLFSLIQIASALFLTVSCSPLSVPEKNSSRLDVVERITDTATLNSALTQLEQHPDSSNLHRSIWGYYTRTGKFQELVDIASETYEYSLHTKNYELTSFALVYLAQAYLFLDEYSRVESSLAELELCMKQLERENVFLRIMEKNIRAILAMKTNLDYSIAVSYFKDSYELLKEVGDTLSECMVLYNISSIYLARKDNAGLSYSEQAYELSQHIEDMNVQTLCAVGLSEMYFLSDDIARSYEYASRALHLVDSCNFLRNKSLVYGNYAKALFLKGDIEHTDYYFRQAIANMNPAQEDMNISIFLKYGDFLREQHLFESAISMYQKAYAISDKTNNIEHILSILDGISVCYDCLNDKDQAFFYLKKYQLAADSLNNIEKERAFNNLLVQYNNIRQEEKEYRMEIELLKKSRGNLLLIMIVLGILLLLAYTYLLYRRKNMMYKRIVNQYKELESSYVKKELLQSGSSDEEGKPAGENRSRGCDVHREIFDQLEDLMLNHKLYREKNLSLDMVSDILGTNNTYVSKVVNQYAGKTFPNYVNSYRIQEVLSTLLDKDNDDPIKAIFDKAGYQSKTTAYRIFQNTVGCSPTEYRTRTNL